MLARDTMLAYPDYTQPFDVYTDASSLQFGAVIVQNGQPITLFLQKSVRNLGELFCYQTGTFKYSRMP